MSMLAKPWPVLLFACGCGASTGQAWVHESPSAPWQGSTSSDEYLAEESGDTRSKLPREPDEEQPFVPRPVITLGQNDMVTDESGRVIADDTEQHRFSRSSYGSSYYGGYGYGYGYGGYYGYGYRPGGGYYPSYPSGGRPSGGGGSQHGGRGGAPPMAGDWARVPSYGPPMMDKTSPAPAWH